MRKLYTVSLALIMTAGLFAQAPQKMSYQAVVRNASGQLVINLSVGMKISILQGSITGTVVYSETQIPTANANGLVSIEIGAGTGFDAINWANGPYFIKTETDPLGGTSYTISGTSQLLSVPYALRAKVAESISGTITETDPIYNASVAKNIRASDTTRWSSKYYLGQQKDGGVIFYIYKGSDGLEHGLIVAKNESANLKWQNTAVLVNANRSWDGNYNTSLMTDSPVKTYITGLGAGWYLPAIDELRILFNNRYIVNKAIGSIAGANYLSDIQYWSSTENQSTDALELYMFNSTSASAGKTGIMIARAIRTF